MLHLQSYRTWNADSADRPRVFSTSPQPSPQGEGAKPLIEHLTFNIEPRSWDLSDPAIPPRGYGYRTHLRTSTDERHRAGLEASTDPHSPILFHSTFDVACSMLDVRSSSSLQRSTSLLLGTRGKVQTTSRPVLKHPGTGPINRLIPPLLVPLARRPPW